MLIPYSRSFLTRIPHPELLSSLSRISFSSGSRTSVENLLDQHASEALISLVPDLHYLLFSEKGALLSPSLLFSQPITNLVCNRCHFSGKSRISQISYSVNVSRIQCCFLGRSLVPGIPFLSPRKKTRINIRLPVSCISSNVRLNSASPLVSKLIL